MAKEPRNTFTSGEMAKMANISKQALYYYERKNLLKPVKIDKENNYSYYSLPEHHKLEMIVCLRDLGFSIQSIKEFIDYRDENILIDMLREKKLELDCKYQTIAEQQSNVSKILEKSRFIKNLMLDRVGLEQLPAYRMIVSEKLSEVDGDKNNLVIRLNFMKKIFHFNHYDLDHGWFLSKENLQNRIFSPVGRFFAIATGEGSKLIDQYINFELASKYYVTIYGKGNYHSNCKNWTDNCLRFIEHNGLEVDGDALVIFVKDYWYTNEKDEYVFKLAIPVK